MKPTHVYLLIPVFLFGIGCGTQTRRVSRYEEVNKYSEKGIETRLALSDGQNLIAENLHVEDDSVHWIDPQTKKAHSVSTEMVDNITLLRRQRAARAGMAYGALLGVVSGLGIGYAYGDDPESDCLFLCITREEQAILAGLLGIPAGAIVGSFIWSAPVSDVKYLTEESQGRPISEGDKSFR